MDNILSVSQDAFQQAMDNILSVSRDAFQQAMDNILSVSRDAFQQAMDNILSQCPGTIGITDDVIVHGKDTQKHDLNLHRLMEVARKNGLVFNPEKCHIKTPKSGSLG